MDETEARELFHQLKTASHYHVVALASDDDCLADYADEYRYDYRVVNAVLSPDDSYGEHSRFFMGYTDAHEKVNALSYAADLIAPATGNPTPRRGLVAVWIVEGRPRGCPLAHGDDDAGYNEGSFLERAMRQEPYWQAGDS